MNEEEKQKIVPINALSMRLYTICRYLGKIRGAFNNSRMFFVEAIKDVES